MVAPTMTFSEAFALFALVVSVASLLFTIWVHHDIERREADNAEFVDRWRKQQP